MDDQEAGENEEELGSQLREQWQVLSWRGRVKSAADDTQYRPALPRPAAAQTSAWPPGFPLGGCEGCSRVVRGET